MSKKQFVNYKDSGFWAYDVALGVFLKHLIDIAEEYHANVGANWLMQEISSWRVAATISDYSFEINRYWSPTQLVTFRRLAKEAFTRIGQRESFTPRELELWDVLDGKGIFPRGAEAISTAPIVELGEAITALASGTLPEAPAGTLWFYGTPTGRSTIKMRER